MANTRKKSSSRAANKQQVPATMSSLESLNDEAATKLLDMGPEIESLRKSRNITDDRNSSDHETELQKEADNNVTLEPQDKNNNDLIDKNDERIHEAKMNTFVGFIRLANFLSATTVIFILVLYLMNVDPNQWTDVKDHLVVKHVSTFIQLVFLCFFAIAIWIDSIGTISFCWREYGELSSIHTDATSIIFIFCPSRWMFRIGSGLIFITALSLPVMNQLQHEILPDTEIVTVCLLCGCFVFSGLGFMLSLCVPHYRVPWLQGKFKGKTVKDEADEWKKCLREQDWQERKNFFPRTPSQKNLHTCYVFFQILASIVCFSTYLIAFILHGITISIISQRAAEIFSNTIELYHRTKSAFMLVSIMSSLIIELTCLALLVRSVWVKRCQSDAEHRGKIFHNEEQPWIPYHIWLLAPYILSTSLVHFLETDFNHSLFFKIQGSITEYFAKWAVVYNSAWLMAFLVFGGLIYLMVGFFINLKYMHSFLKANFNSDRFGSRKVIRILDTTGNLSMLIGLIIGITSIFIDQYDIILDPEGLLKDIIKEVDKFKHVHETVMTEIQQLADKFDLNWTCSEVYGTLAGGTLAGLGASLIPGASPIANLGVKSAYYSARAANGLTKMARKLKYVGTKIWSIISFVYKFSSFVVTNLKKIVLTTNSLSMLRLLPLLPPVVYGLYVLFGAFWPSRLVFFSKKQRQTHLSSRLQLWTLALVILIIAVLINTVLLDELVQLLDDGINNMQIDERPLAKVSLEYNLGWKMAMSASAFALLGTFFNWIAAFIMFFIYDNDHENLTNAEKDWADELKKRELVAVSTPYGKRIMRQTHLNYMRSRISSWNWVLPIILTLIACGFGVGANFYPKLKMIREPRGAFGRYIDEFYRKVSLFETDIDIVKNDTEKECFPYKTLNDVLNESPDLKHLKNPLVVPVEQFKNMSMEILQPLKDILSGLRKRIVLDIDENLFGGNMELTIQNLQYIGLLFTLPRVICLLVLFFGAFMAMIFKCQMQISCDSLAPQKIVDAYGKIAIFSLVYVVGAQLALFNILSTFGIPFYHIYVEFGPGFVYDVVADSILIATYIGMNNEFFFAIPKKKVTVSYTLPGLSPSGPNIPGQIL